jgi:hypothetical protein
MTLGEYRVGISFNPGGNVLVADIKKKAAELIDICNDMKGEISDHAEANRCWALAMTAFEDAAMWAVKAATKPCR